MTTLDDRLSRWLSDWLSKNHLSPDFQVTPLAGDGSPRPFFRVHVTGRSFVLLSEPNWTLSKDYPAHQACLKKAGIAVPGFFAINTQLGALLMEDLGDELLQSRLLSDKSAKMPWLEKCAALLAKLHGATFPVRTDLPVSTRRFDAKKYFEEFQFTFEHLHKGLLKQGEIPPEILEETRVFTREIERFQPEVFSHRDYHTRNVLVFKDELVLIDFQDARLGPAEYDLASLFYDAYIPLNESERETLLAVYKTALGHFPLAAQIDWHLLPQRLDQIAFQRTVKAAGSFASFFTRYQKKTHLPYLIPALTAAKSLQKKLGSKVPSLPIEEWLEQCKQVQK